MAQPVVVTIARGDAQRTTTAVDADGTPAGGIQQTGKRNAAAARACIHQNPCGVLPSVIQKKLHQLLGFRARDKRAPGNIEWDAVEPALVGDVGKRLAFGASCQPSLKAAHLALVQWPLGMCQQPCSVALQAGGKQQLGFTPSFGNACHLQLPRRPLERVVNASHDLV